MPGRDDRLAQLYRRYGPTIYARCRRMLRDDTAAEDATQETFLRVLRHIEKTPDDREALSWIYRIATNHCLNVLRYARKRPQSAEEPAAAPVLAENPEAALADRDFVARALRRAPHKLATVAWLHHVDGLPQGEVATVLGISRRTVVNRLADFARRIRLFAARG
jgi:RNA polymerase sigma-70 factor, ECF subfamily